MDARPRPALVARPVMQDECMDGSNLRRPSERSGFFLFVGAAFITVAAAALVMYMYASPQRRQTISERIYEACWLEFGHDDVGVEDNGAALRRVNDCIRLATDRINKIKMDRVLDSVSTPK
jgi:hypothetical protein